ncbi:YwmB family TATA-box binding protein [Natranaerobius trueperi]|uniref:TATA-box binding protein n=1 Tax=Natranaerobius trueperi TaxID=759412 RepID=A0A226BZY0_9FIRM|nr:YwmB family TATA-box binding protein [Natranaerobius trueperi]OWZ84608.1 hypothetical protein CDO51_02280 [Natranaerobius trueperi]
MSKVRSLNTLTIPLLAVCITLFLLYTSMDESIRAEENLEEDVTYLKNIVDDMDGEIELGELTGHAIESKYLSFDEMEQVLQSVMNELAVSNLFSEEYTIDKSKNHNIKTARVVLNNDECELHVSIQSIANKDILLDAQTHIVINITDKTDELEIINDYHKRIRSVFSILGAEGEITTCLSGFLSDKLTKDEKRNLLGEKIDKRDIVNERSFENSNVVKKSGYSSKIENLIMVDDKKQNISLVLSDDKIKGKTAFRVATPLVNSDY